VQSTIYLSYTDKNKTLFPVAQTDNIISKFKLIFLTLKVTFLKRIHFQIKTNYTAPVNIS